MNIAVENPLLGIGLYTAAEAAPLLGLPRARIARWLKGHSIAGRRYEPLWPTQVDVPDDGIFLGFRDLMELRAAAGLMDQGVSSVAVRKAIEEARSICGDHPLSQKRFRTDGRRIFLQIANETGDETLLDLLKKQYAFGEVLKQSLKDTEFAEGEPVRWWPAARSGGVLIDPQRSFGQPIEAQSGVPTKALAAAAVAEGSAEQAARIWLVSVASVRRAIDFEASLRDRAA